MNKLSITLALLLACATSPLFAQRATIYQTSDGKMIGLAYTPFGVVMLTEIKIVKLPDPTQPGPGPVKVTKVTYVFEKDQNSTPRPVATALIKLNAASAGSIVATEFEQGSDDGTGDIPEQYKVALKAAREAGLPALVVQSGSTVVRVIKSPTTEQQVMDAAK